MILAALTAIPPASFRDLIARWPTTRSFARDAGCSPMLVRQWRHRDFVPAHYWPRIVEGAGRRGIGFIDAGLLAQLAAHKRGGTKGTQA
jgi:hypothetical protein